MRFALVLTGLVLLAAPALAARAAAPRCTFRTAQACADRELATQAAIVPAVLRTVVGMVPADSAVRAAAGPATTVEGCYTITTDTNLGTFSATLAACPAGDAGTVDGTIGGTADVQFVGSITGESGCSPFLSGAALGTTCPVAAQVTVIATVDTTRTDGAGRKVALSCSASPTTLLNAIIAVDVVETRVAPDTPDATCFTIPGFCATFTAEPKVVALTAPCTSQAMDGSRAARKPVAVELKSLIFPVVPPPAEVGCALGGDVAITPARRVGITASFDGDCVPAVGATRRRRHVDLPGANAPVF
jgi:hypothetical protein